MMKIYNKNNTNTIQGGSYALFDPDRDVLILNDRGDIETFSLSSMTEKIKSKYSSQITEITNQNDLIFTLSSTRHDIKIILNEYVYKNPSYDGKNTTSWYDVSGVALIKTR